MSNSYAEYTTWISMHIKVWLGLGIDLNGQEPHSVESDYSISMGIFLSCAKE